MYILLWFTLSQGLHLFFKLRNRIRLSLKDKVVLKRVHYIPDCSCISTLTHQFDKYIKRYQFNLLEIKSIS